MALDRAANFSEFQIGWLVQQLAQDAIHTHRQPAFDIKLLLIGSNPGCQQFCKTFEQNQCHVSVCQSRQTLVATLKNPYLEFINLLCLLNIAYI